MCRLHSLVALVVVLALVGGVEAAPKGKKKAKKSETTLIHGKVEAVHHDGKTGLGTITIKVHHAKKTAKPTKAAKAAKKAGGAAKAGKKKHHDLVVHVIKDTVFHKGNQPATFKEVHKGEHVAVQLEGGKKHDAKSVTIEVGKKNAKKSVAKNKGVAKKNAAKKKPKG
jgi:hypothetical protein